MEVLAQPKQDDRPENIKYKDEGCGFFPSCLNCPLPECRYAVDELGKRKIGKELRDREIKSLHAEGWGIKELMERFGVRKRTIYRALQEVDDG